MTINYRKIISTLLVFVIAVVTGFSVGKIYVDNLEVPQVVGVSEDDLREAKELVKQWATESKNKKPSDFNALQAFLIAENNLNESEEFYKIMTGMVFATAGVRQQMKGERLKKDGVFYYNKLSPSTSSLSPAICSRIIYDTRKQDEIKVYPTGTFESTSPDIIGSFSETNLKILTLEKFKETFNTAPSTVMPYIISSNTWKEGKNIRPEKSGGNYVFSISIDGANLTLAGLCYAYEINFSSGMGSLPKWVSLEMKVMMDENFNFVQIEYDETYKMNAPVIGWTPVNDKFVDKFYFPQTALPGEIPTVDEFLNGRVA